MLTIDEIKDISFRRGRGYKGEDVDAFIDELGFLFLHLFESNDYLIDKRVNVFSSITSAIRLPLA